MSFSEIKEYDDQIVIVDGIGITHFIPRRASQTSAVEGKRKKKRKKK